MREDFANNANDLSIARADGTTNAIDLTRFQDHDPNVCLDGSCSAETPDWVPDGSRIYFTATWIPFVSIWSIDPDGADPVQEPNVTDFDGAPAISSDGTLVAFDGGNADGSEQGIYIRPLGSLNATKLTSGPAGGYDTNPDISPDSSRVVFQRIYPRSSLRTEIWIVNTDGTGLQKLLSAGHRWGDPHFSPDGSKILVQGYWERATFGRNTNEYVMNPDGSHLRNLTNLPNGSFAFAGDWSPDGTHIAYMRFLSSDDHVQLRAMDANGNDESLIADCPIELFCNNPSWGVYEGALPAIAHAATRSAHATRHARVSRRAATRRLYRVVVRRLSR